MWKWTSTSRSVLVHFHIVENWKVGKFGKHAPAVTFQTSTFHNVEMDEHLEVGACPFPHCGKLESWKVWKIRPGCCNPGAQSSPDLQQRKKTRIGRLNLCRMKLPHRQRQQERASRVRRDHRLALRTAFIALLLVITSVVSAAATIQPPEVRRNVPSHASVFAETITRTSPRGKGLFSGNIA